MQENESDTASQAKAHYVPTFAGYSERDLNAMLESLNPENPVDRVSIIAIERRLALLAE
jgi:hypothetical protein